MRKYFVVHHVIEIKTYYQFVDGMNRKEALVNFNKLDDNKQEYISDEIIELVTDIVPEGRPDEYYEKLKYKDPLHSYVGKKVNKNIERNKLLTKDQLRAIGLKGSASKWAKCSLKKCPMK